MARLGERPDGVRDVPRRHGRTIRSRSIVVDGGASRRRARDAGKQVSPARLVAGAALACAQATLVSARASKASRAHIAVETRASAAKRASSKKSRLANAQLDAATSRALKAAGVSCFAKASSATYRDTRDVVSAAKRRVALAKAFGTRRSSEPAGAPAFAFAKAQVRTHTPRASNDARRFAADDANVSTVRAMSSAKETFILAFVAASRSSSFSPSFFKFFKSPAFSGLLRVSARTPEKAHAAFASSWGFIASFAASRRATNASASYNSGSLFSPELAERPRGVAASCAYTPRERSALASAAIKARVGSDEAFSFSSTSFSPSRRSCVLERINPFVRGRRLVRQKSLDVVPPS